MAQSTYRPEHAQRVIEVARNELEVLLKQRRAITKQVKQVQRTVEGLNALFAESTGGAQPNGGNSVSPDIVSSDRDASFTPCVKVSLETPETETDLEDVSERGPGWNDTPRIDCLKPRLERACRIALLESEQAATAAEIYDRIMRRGSYQLNRYKHPLVQVISTLDALVHRGEVQTGVENDCRRWQWNLQQQDMRDRAVSFGLAEQLDVP